MTFEALLEQHFKAGLGGIWPMKIKSLLELKYGVMIGYLTVEYQIIIIGTIGTSCALLVP